MVIACSPCARGFRRGAFMHKRPGERSRDLGAEGGLALSAAAGVLAPADTSGGGSPAAHSATRPVRRPARRARIAPNSPNAVASSAAPRSVSNARGKSFALRSASPSKSSNRQRASVVRIGAWSMRLECGLEELHRVLERQQCIGALAGARRVVDSPIDIAGGKEVACQLRQHSIDIGATRYLDRLADERCNCLGACRPQFVVQRHPDQVVRELVAVRRLSPR